MSNSFEQLKREAAWRALAYVQDGMILGLGTGSTTSYFIEMLGEQIRSGAFSDIRAVPTSQETERKALKAGIPLIGLAAAGQLDLAVDGADEVDPQLNLIKGLGKALLREKIVETYAQHFVVIVDESKLTPHLGRGPLPIEVVQYEAPVHERWLQSIASRAELWLDEEEDPYVTDNGNYLVRCWFNEGIPDVYELAEQLSRQPGIVEHGLFLDMADRVIVAQEDGIRILDREDL